MIDDDLFVLFDGIESDSIDDAISAGWTEIGESEVQSAIEQFESDIPEDCGAWGADGGFDIGPMNDDTTDAIVETDGIFSPIFRIFDDFWYDLNGQTDIVTKHHFSADGNFDAKNNVIVEGNVADDIKYIDQQSHGSCSLMAQEQFVERYTGQPIPEDYLEWRAEKWGVYDPDIGTIFSGQTMVLDHFNIPYERHYFCDLEDLDGALQSDNDAIIGVDAREFYDDPSIPPGSGHAVAVVGRGIDPVTHEVKGYYVTDSNFAEAAHFVDAELLENAWSGLSDMIVIPNKSLV